MKPKTTTVTVTGALAREPIARTTDTGGVVTSLRLVRVNSRALAHGVHITDATSMVDVEFDGELDPFWASFVDVGDPVHVTDATVIRPPAGSKAALLRTDIKSVSYRPSFAD
ncbi:hypothetical protein [Stackebrandtia nassauensis]|uniref:Uncharacterized protein n=1 Tax=Stackebrandtia nassauensis (strain DSM 44728 / CIP 108903 / NRRL B-16338 / NBRC 102104 / LLR-40K-21) TaxID=446470 RepID=D3PV06_STANL|nr:hypothetical protein [Stackebrandtia nassauensis]ADD45030.1 hypothetical protein Snas_5398 [Stackebrandtia nassauensis DSM 44728]